MSISETIQIGHHGNKPVYLDASGRARHLYIVGQTGTGKSTLLLNLIAQDLAAGRGCALLDPHGDLAEAALSLLPTARADDLVYLEPAHLERPIGFNPLARVSEDRRPLLVENMVAALHAIWPDSWGPRLEHILSHALRLLMDVPGSTLIALPRLLQDDGFRSACLCHASDPIVRAFWLHEYAAYPPRFREEAIAPVLNKIGRVLLSPALRNILAQPKSTIDLRFMMDNRRVLLANLSKGAIGDGPGRLLGALLVTAFAQAALSRRDTPEASRVPFHLYIDEFQNFASTGFDLILSEARKYGLTLTLAHQYIDQLPEHLRHSVFGNAGSILSFRVGASDAPILSRQLDIANEAAIKELPNYTARASILTDGQPTQAFQLSCAAPPKPLHHRSDRHKRHSHLRFGRHRDAIERRIAALYEIQGSHSDKL